MAARVLHQFPISHYCEKTRWHLDWKGLTYTTRNLLPGVHLVVNRRLGGAGTVPLLVDDREDELRPIFLTEADEPVVLQYKFAPAQRLQVTRRVIQKENMRGTDRSRLNYQETTDWEFTFEVKNVGADGHVDAAMTNKAAAPKAISRPKSSALQAIGWLVDGV